jgi:ATPase subunit of ABC transporter with duplicated ATPase domains
MPRILELASAALRSYGGNYVDYQQQRELEQQAAAPLEHAVTERRRTRARCKEHDACRRRSAQTLRTIDTLNIASFERVAWKGGKRASRHP